MCKCENVQMVAFVRAVIKILRYSHICTLTTHFFHSVQLVSVKLHDDFVQLRALAQGLNAGCLGVSVDLRDGLVPLLLCGGFGVALV